MSLPAPVQTVSVPRRLGEIEDEITELAAHIHAATDGLLELIREFDGREDWGRYSTTITLADRTK